jgi:hypothetical protein
MRVSTEASAAASASAAVAAAQAASKAAAREQCVATAAGNTIGRLENVVAVLWADFAHYVGIVTILADYTDEAMLRVAEAELAMMDELEDVPISTPEVLRFIRTTVVEGLKEIGAAE